jgi:hypothetical protein
VAGATSGRAVPAHEQVVETWGDFTHSSPMALTMPAKATGRILSGDQDRFSITVSAPQTVNVKLCSLGDCQGWLFVYKADGTSFGSQWVQRGRCTAQNYALDQARTWQFSVDLTTNSLPGRYSVEVRPAGNTVAPTLTFEPGDGLPAGTTLAVPARVQARKSPGDPDAYAFNVPRAGRVALRICGDLWYGGFAWVSAPVNAGWVATYFDDCSYKVYDFAAPGTLGVSLAAAPDDTWSPGEYSIDVRYADARPTPSITLRQPVLVANAVNVTVSTQPPAVPANTIRFWVHGYGFFDRLYSSTQPSTSATLTFPTPPGSGTYSVQAQLQMNGSAVGDLTPALYFQVP